MPKPLKVLQVVTLVTPTGSFGGPTRVSINQSKELLARGHQVQIIGGWAGSGAPPSDLYGVPTRLFPVRRLIRNFGFSGMISVPLILDLWKQISDFDLVHVHLARDLITLPSAVVSQLRRRPLVIQTHGMIDESRRMMARILDPLVTKPAIRGAAANLVLTDKEGDALEKVARGRMQIRLPNGVPAMDGHIGATEREREVLFCARLHPRKRVAAFVEMAAILRSRGTKARYVVAGPDEGCLSHLKDLISRFSLEDSLSYEGPLLMEDVPRRIARAFVYVLPSFDEPFPMSLLEALSVGTPSVCTKGCDIGPSLTRAGAVLVSDGTPSDLADNVQLLLDSNELWESLAIAGKRAVSDEYSLPNVVDRLEHAYYLALGS